VIFFYIFCGTGFEGADLGFVCDHLMSKKEGKSDVMLFFGGERRVEGHDTYSV
jgi:hypothetical protein